MKPPDVQHLYFDGRHYDQRYQPFVQDIPFWIGMAQKYGGPILELASGTGRISIPLAKENFRVTGVDISDSMLAETRRKSSEEDVAIEWVRTDIRDFDLQKRFKLIIFPANTICHLLDLDDVEACLRCVKKHLETGGRFVIDVFTPSFDILLRDPTQRYPHSEYPDPNGGGKILVTETNEYDSASQINRIGLFYRLPGREEEFVEELLMRIYFPQELDELLKNSGFEIEAKYGEYDLKRFDSESAKQLIVCRRV